MGAVSVMKAIHENDLNVSGIILECPFGTMYETVCARFNSMKIPSFPMANLLVFWGGLQNGYWAFGHNPDKYASNISVPTLLLTGGVDEKVSLSETKRIFENLVGSKKLIIYPNAGHENYLNKYEAEWTNDIHTFLAQNN
jgi:alpha-beta hydrolase superfamily lysophospholipase